MHWLDRDHKFTPISAVFRAVLFQLSQIRDFKFLVIGNFDYSFDGLDVDVLQWNKHSEIADLGRIDIGIYPLHPLIG